MLRVRARAVRLLTVGTLSDGSYAVLTGLAMLFVAYLLGSSPGDPASPWVAVGLAVVGVWQVESGLRAELRRRRSARDC